MLALAIGSLTACGGGGGSSDPPPPPPPPVCQPIVDSAGNAVACTDELWAGGGDSASAAGADGTAGDGAPIVGATIRLTDVNGKTASAVTDAQGYYRMNLTGMTAPFTLMVTKADGTPSHHGYTVQTPKARGFITINVSGLTDKLCSDMAVAVGKSGAAGLTGAILTANPNAPKVALAGLVDKIKPQIEAAGLSPDTFDPVTTFFRPNLAGYDLVLETVAVYIDPTGATQIVPKPQTACTLPSHWKAGSNECMPTTTPGYAASGSQVRLTDSTGALVGSAEFACSNGTLSVVGTPTCAPPATNNPCTAPGAGWAVNTSACTADTPPRSMTSGERQTLSDSIGPSTGATTYVCTNGALSTVTDSTSCVTAAQGCAAPATSWSVGTATCVSDSGSATMISGATQTLSDSVGSTRGAITYSCNNGTASVVGAPSCSSSADACSAPSADWTVGASNCRSDTTPTSMASGTTQTLSDHSAPTTGSIMYQCSNGALGVLGTPECTTAIVDCTAPPSSWIVGASTCRADTTPSPLPAGQTITLIDASGLTTGSIQWTCAGGTLTTVGTPLCETSQPAPCAAPPSSWAVDSASCSSDATPRTMTSGSTQILVDSRDPNTGSITYSCTDGTLKAGTPSCQPTGQACDTTTLKANGWTVSELTCLPDSAPKSVSSGITIVVNDATAPEVGSASFKCTDGVLVEQPGSSCIFRTSAPARSAAQDRKQ